MSYSFLKPISVGKMILKNRIIVPAMARYLCRDGYVTDDYVEYLRAIAGGGVAMVTVGIMPVDLNWPSTMPTQPCVGDDKYIPGLVRAVAAIHAGGAKAAFQPWMPGRLPYTYADATERAQDIALVDKLTKDQILSIEEKYAQAALRCAMAGVDAVEWHNAHNYLGEQFYSPYFNHRTDEYGQQSPENCMRFARECLTKARKKLDDAGYEHVALTAKLNGTETVNDSITPEHLAACAKELEKAGVQLITVNGGGGLTNMEGMAGDGHRAEGWKVKYAQIVKEAVSIPVAASGNLKTPSYVDSIIREGKCDMAALGRESICDPEWVDKCRKGREDLIRYCLSCMHCIYAQPQGECGCTMNPRSRREAFVPKAEDFPKTGKGRKVLIAGAGPAGCIAAVTLAQRGFSPILCDKAPYLGGMMVAAAMPVAKKEFLKGVNYYTNMLRELKVEIRLNTEVTAEMIREENPYAVIAAVGSEELIPNIPGLRGGNVIPVRKYLLDRPQIRGRKVVVIGAGQTGFEAARMLAVTGNDVTEIEMRPRSFAVMLEQKLDLKYAEEAGVKMAFEYKVLEVTEQGVVAEQIQSKEKVTFEADIVIASLGVRPNSAEAEKLASSGIERFYNVGDSSETGMIWKATAAAYDCALGLE